MARLNKSYNEQGATNACPSGKRSFTTRRDAHRIAMQMRKEGTHVRPYLCDRGCGLWHNGGVRPEVLRGEYSADDWYAMPRDVGGAA